MSKYIYNRIMINYNIMNIILDKKAFEEWQDKVIKVHKEFDAIYCSLGNQCVRIRYHKICSKCKDWYFIHFTYRQPKGKLYNDKYIASVNTCRFCYKIILPINY